MTLEEAKHTMHQEPLMQVKIKPEAKKIELKVPIDHGPRLVNYDDEADDSIQLRDLTLASTQVRALPSWMSCLHAW